MPVPSYGVLRGKAVEGKLAGRGGKKPHFQIHIRAQDVDHRIAVNVVSDQSPSELLFLLAPNFRHPVLDGLATVGEGFTPIPSRPGGMALDFLRGALFEAHDMRPLPFDLPGPANDLAEIFEFYVNRAIGREADFFAFGSKWGPEPDKTDDYFGFQPGNGIHDIHLNQGSPPPHAKDNGVWQDGALFIHFPVEDTWLGFFLAFQSQFAPTDERGDPIPGSPKFGQGAPGAPLGPLPHVAPDELPVEAGVRIVAALVNPPPGDDPHETVTLLNTGPEPVELAGWSIADATGAGFRLEGPTIGPGDTVRIALTDPTVVLSNQGGTITLRDGQGIEVDAVAWTKEQVSAPGWTVAF